MKNFEFLLAAYMAFWLIFLAYHFTIAQRLSRAEQELERLKHQLHP